MQKKKHLRLYAPLLGSDHYTPLPVSHDQAKQQATNNKQQAEVERDSSVGLRLTQIKATTEPCALHPRSCPLNEQKPVAPTHLSHFLDHSCSSPHLC